MCRGFKQHLVDTFKQIQALDHTQPGLPMKKGRAGTMTHDLYEGCGANRFFEPCHNPPRQSRGFPLPARRIVPLLA